MSKKAWHLVGTFLQILSKGQLLSKILKYNLVLHLFTFWKTFLSVTFVLHRSFDKFSIILK